MRGLECPAASEGKTSTGKATAVVHFVEPVQHDVTNHAYKTSCNPSSGTNFHIGTARVECVTTDMRGINKTCHFNITVEGMSIILIPQFV